MADPFEVLTTPVPAVDTAAASAVLAEGFGVDGGDLEPLSSERDCNFLVRTAGGDKAVLKIANSAEEPAVTDLQTRALLHIEAADPGLDVPRILRTSSGATSTTIEAADGRKHVVRLVSWLDGVPLQDTERMPDHAAGLGALLARLGQALENFSHPAAGYWLLWDLKRAAALRPLLEHVADRRLRALCAARLDRFGGAVAPRLAALRWQVIHNDLNPSNVLVDPEQRLCGVIDFGDMVRAPLIVDVAVAAAYLLRDEEEPLADLLTFTRAYSRAVPLSDDEIDLLFDLTLTRSTMTVLITHWRAARYPENRDYILRSETRARRMLERLADASHAVSLIRSEIAT